jgi:hypothetical protein
LLAGSLFGREVLGGAHDLTGCGQRDLVGEPGDPKVGDFDAVFRVDEEVSGFHVAVDEALGVSGRQGARCLGDDRQGAVGGEDFFAVEDGAERVAGDELHDQVAGAFFFPVVKDVRHAGVVEQGGVLGFSAEAPQEVGVSRVLFLENFDGDDSTEHGVACFPYFTHAADGDTFGQFVSAT